MLGVSGDSICYIYLFLMWVKITKKKERTLHSLIFLYYAFWVLLKSRNGHSSNGKFNLLDDIGLTSDCIIKFFLLWSQRSKIILFSSTSWIYSLGVIKCLDLIYSKLDGAGVSCVKDIWEILFSFMRKLILHNIIWCKNYT